MRYECEPIDFAIRVYEDGEGVDYVATALIRKYGDRGWMSQISSPRLFEALPEHFGRLLDECGLTTLEGYMSESMYRALRMKAHKFADLYVDHRGLCAGRLMPWVVLRKLDNVEVGNG